MHILYNKLLFLKFIILDNYYKVYNSAVEDPEASIILTIMGLTSEEIYIGLDS